MRLFASIIKELILLARDKAGLALLFLMPAFLVVVITLIQDHVTTLEADVLFVDEDGGVIAKEIKNVLKSTSSFRLIDRINDVPVTADQAQQLVADGKYHFSIVLPKNLSSNVDKRSRYHIENQFFPSNQKVAPPSVPSIILWFDPVVQGSFRAAMHASLNGVIKSTETKLMLEHTFALLPKIIKKEMPDDMASFMGETDLDVNLAIPDIFDDNNFINVEQIFATKMGFRVQPTAVQQNVPAWTIFGIFFIVLPLAGSIINERESGTLLRLKVMPVSYTTLITGKLTAYSLVCLIQFVVIFLASQIIIPLFGVESFDPGGEIVSFLALLFAVIIAANSYGVFLGTICKSFKQVSIFAPISIVIAAAFGGILVPVYALPDFIRPISILSPLYWGQSGFYDLLLRHGDFNSVLPEITALVCFGLSLCTVAIVYNRSRTFN